MTTERWSFPGPSGARLAARVERPTGPVRGWALFAHCFTCSKDLKSAVWLTQGLSARGIGVVRFDFTGIGESEGDFTRTGFASNVDDVLAAVRAMQEAGWAPGLLVGHSLGGAALLAAADRLPPDVPLATLGAMADLAPLHAQLLERAPALARAEEAEVRLGERTFRLHRSLLAELASRSLESHLATLTRPLLLLHAPTDEVVPYAHAERLYGWARGPKSLVALDGASHLLMDARDAAYAAELVAAWAARYLPAPAPPTEAPLPEEERTVVATAGPRGFETRLRSGPHRLVSDEPRSVGGADAGMGPYELLLAALGACTAMTLRMYADLKQLPLEGVEVRLRHQKVHAADCAECTTREGRVDTIERELVLRGPLSEAQRQRLLEIAERCPVHRTLHSEVHVHTRTAPG